MAKSVKRFERSNGLDTALYKNYLYLFTFTLTIPFRVCLQCVRDRFFGLAKYLWRFGNMYYLVVDR